MKINHTSVVTGPVENFFSYSGWPTVCADENDILYTVCSGHRLAHVCPFGKTLMYKSRDMGKTWTVPSIIDDSYFDDRDSGILYLGSGKMLVTNFKHPVEEYQTIYRRQIERDAGQIAIDYQELCETLEKPEMGGSFYKVSNDYGETWGEKKQIPVSCPHGPIRLADGNLLYIGKELHSYGADEKGTINAYISKPDPIEFKKLSSCPQPKGYDWNRFYEPHCVQLDNGRIMALYRAHIDANSANFTMYKTFSDDGGKTWSDPEATGICGSPPHLLKLRDGRILLSYGRRIEPYGIYCRLISPNGTFSEEEIALYQTKDADIGYPATVELKNGDLVTVFYGRVISDRCTSIVSVNWTL